MSLKSGRGAFWVFPAILQHARVDLRVPHILWIEYEDYWDDRFCQGWVWMQPKFRAQLGGQSWALILDSTSQT